LGHDAAGLKPVFFAEPSEFRAWLEKHHGREQELFVGFYKKGTGRPSITWPEAVDEALCFGWIDGVRKSLGEDSYRIRFTPRKPGSTWSAVNVGRVEELTRLGRMRPAGLAAFEKRTEAKTGTYAYEQKEDAALEKAEEKQFRANKPAWEFFQSQPPWYRRTAIWRVVSAKKEETRKSRLAKLIEESAQGRRT
jgi:uncharacterized protein YdeI (YjbR/CyaY-like superfamily)